MSKIVSHFGLFEGFGGFSIAAKWMGWKTIAYCENNATCQQILQYHFPEAESFIDIKTTCFKKYANKVTILTGGFPCQPFSLQGCRRGSADNRYLWPEMLRAIREISPAYVVAENVLGLLNWQKGKLFSQIKYELENEGYQVQCFVLPAACIGAPHRRQRIFIVAHSTSRRHCAHNIFTVADKKKESTELYYENVPSWEAFPTEPPFLWGNDGISQRLDNIAFPKLEVESIRGFGNAVVPQLVYLIYQTITNAHLLAYGK